MAQRIGRKRSMRWKTVVLAGVALAIAVMTLGSSVSAATTTGNPPSQKPKTLIDPFALKAAVPTSVVTGSQVSASKELNTGRQPIRIPFRPIPRSAFQPIW